jgi:hypothetical protein
MAYTPREIKDRVAVGDDIFIVEDLGNNRIKLIPAPTHVSEPGTPINKALLQPMEDHMGDVANPHATTKEQVGLGNVDNVKQATKAEFDAHKSSDDHDGRYYTKSHLDPIIRNLLLNSWIVSHSGTSEHLQGVAYGNGPWVTVGFNGTILTSTSGTLWISRSSGTTYDLQGVAYGDGLWVTVGFNGTISTVRVITL